MFREMRRKDRQLNSERLEEIIVNGEYCTLGTIDKSGYPYTIPVSYVYSDGKIYFHCAYDGQKIDNIKENDKVSINIVGNTKILPGKFSTVYESAVIFGRASIIEGDEKTEALNRFISKYSPGFKEEGESYIRNAKDHTCIVRIDIEHMTGKGRYE
jgi:nitroimidazol reductase NimA-like FMN-containing flavoprotein (pyridoxamine 5'-phosphate oxidase superfamily)